MKKLFTLFSSLTLVGLVNIASYARTVNEATAKAVGCNYLISRGLGAVVSSDDLTTAYTATRSIAGSPVVTYYIFNTKNAPGFVIVSGDDRTIPVLAYSGEVAFDEAKMAPDAKWYMNGYSSQIAYVIQNDLPAKGDAARQWSSLEAYQPRSAARSAARTTSVFPSSTYWLVQTKWNQEPHYNADCPTGTPTGCVATCMAEIMQYWHWPIIGCGSHSYVQTTTPTFGVQSADFGSTAYDWATMDASLTSSTPATALLMYHAGVSVNMNYTTSSAGSGSYVIELTSPIINCAEYALKTYFHYKPTLQGYSRVAIPSLAPAISDTDWITMIENELNLLRPVMYTGQGADGGHCWVCDGWDDSIGSTYFHFNFGWSGESNGYYTIDNIAPPALGTGGGSTGNNFDSDQSIVIGIQPDSFPSITGTMVMANYLNSTNSDAVGYGAPFTFTTQIQNTGATTFNGSICAQVFDTSNHLMGTIQTLTGQTLAAGATSSTLTFATGSSGMLGLIPEDYYHVEVMCQPTGDTTWTPVADSGSYFNYNIVDITNDTDIFLYTALNVSSTLPALWGTTINFSTEIANQGNNNFSGTIEALLINISTGVTDTIQTVTSATINSGYVDRFNFSGAIDSSLHVGTYALVIEHQYGGAGNFYVTGNRYYENPILIQVDSIVVTHTGIGNVPSGDNVSVYPNPASDILDIDAPNMSIETIRIVDIAGHEVRKISAGNQSELSIGVGDLSQGVYFVQLLSGTQTITKKIVIAR